MHKWFLYTGLVLIPLHLGAQDNISSKVFREFSVEISTESGNAFNREESIRNRGDTSIVTSPINIWEENEIKVDIGYAQNWASVPWLSLYSLLKVNIVPEYDYNPDGSSIGRLPGKAPTSVAIELGLVFGNYFTFYMDSDLMMGFGLWYNVEVGNHTFGVRGNLELYAGKTSLGSAIWLDGRQSDVNGEASRIGNTEGPIIDEAYFELAWGVDMPKGFNNTFAFRPINFGGDNRWEILEGMFIRFENTLSWSNDSFGLWFTVRYQINNIAFPIYQLADGSQWTTDVSHEMSLLAGFNYTYDFSPSAKK